MTQYPTPEILTYRDMYTVSPRVYMLQIEGCVEMEFQNQEWYLKILYFFTLYPGTKVTVGQCCLISHWSVLGSVWAIMFGTFMMCVSLFFLVHPLCTRLSYLGTIVCAHHRDMYLVPSHVSPLIIPGTFNVSPTCRGTNVNKTWPCNV